MAFKTSNLFSDKHSTLSQLFQIAVALWFFRMVLPGVMFVFLPVFVLLVVFGVAFQWRSIFNKTYLFEFLKTFNPLIILGLFFIIGLLNSTQFYERALRDLFEYGVNLVFLLIFFTLTYRARHTTGFQYVFNKMSRIIWISAFIVAILGLLKFSLQIAGVQLPFAMQWGTTLNQDKNFFALYTMLGIIGLLPRLMRADTFKKRLSSQFVLLVLILNILFAFSFRSPLLLMLLAIGFLIIQVVVWFKIKQTEVVNLARNLRIFSFLYFGAIFLVAFSPKMAITQHQNLVKVYYHYAAINQETLQSEPLTYKTFHLDKWQYALDLYNERSTQQKLFGQGFNYLAQFGTNFHDSPGAINYPHNPILSGLLFSGLVGAVFIVFFIALALYYGGKYLKKYPLYSLMLYTSMLFVLFSGNSLFSVPIFLFLFSLSFMIRHQEISELNIIMNLQKPGAKFLKETFDYILASLALVFLSPLLLFISVMVGFTMGWPVVFSQVRIGQNGKPFRLHKFRSMKKAKTNITVAAGEQNRITRFGKFMRRYKLDELPELWNIIRGDMSFVGPRPDVPGYADELKGDDRVILQLKPGLTGAASLKYMHEEELLAQQPNPVKYNDEVIFPDKVLVNKKYMQKWSLWLDLKIIALTAVGKSTHEDRFL